jgi:hypothetical protein
MSLKCPNKVGIGVIPAKAGIQFLVSSGYPPARV